MEWSNIRFKIPLLKSALYYYSDAYIVVEGTIAILVAENANMLRKDIAFKNDAPFRPCISKINNTLTENAEDLDIVMPMYSLLECSDNYSITSGSLWNYYRDEIDDVDDASEDKPFKYKAKITGKTEVQPP